MSKQPIICDEPIHEWFELTYASYLVLPRSILQSAPVEWQKRFVELLEKLETMYGEVPTNGTYYVSLKDDNTGKFTGDPLRDYERGSRRIEPKSIKVK